MIKRTNESNYLYSYRIDAEDNITYVSDNWSTFAEENMASNQCSSPIVLGKSLWSFISGPETRHVYKLLLGQVREHQKNIQLSINCDSPELKRYIEITLYPLEKGGIEFLSKVVQLTERDAVTILDKAIERNEDIITICSFCKKIATSPDNWVETQDAVQILDLFGSKNMPQLSHGVCPHCAEIIMKDLDYDVTEET